MNAPNGRLSGDGSARARRHGGAFGGSFLQIFFVPLKFYCAQKNLFQTYDKNLFPLKMYFAPQPQNLATGLVLPKLCLQLKYFFEVHSASRCSI